jgi:hypothetical protein
MAVNRLRHLISYPGIFKNTSTRFETHSKTWSFLASFLHKTSILVNNSEESGSPSKGNRKHLRDMDPETDLLSVNNLSDRIKETDRERNKWSKYPKEQFGKR